MALSATTLYDELASNIENFNTEADAIVGWATAFDNYFQDAIAVTTPSPPSGISVTPGTTAGAETAMETGLAGINTSGAAAIVNGITAYWGGLSTAAALIFVAVPPATAITPPSGLSGLQTTLENVFASNVTSNATKEVALTAIANAIHAVQIVGGICVFPPTPTGLGPLPIL
jgi:hypothetical protein